MYQQLVGLQVVENALKTGKGLVLNVSLPVFTTGELAGSPLTGFVIF